MLNKYVYIGLSKAVCLGSGVLNKMSCVLKKKKKKKLISTVRIRI